MGAINSIIFDFDGTLADTRMAIRYTYDQVRTDLNMSAEMDDQTFHEIPRSVRIRLFYLRQSRGAGLLSNEL